MCPSCWEADRVVRGISSPCVLPPLGPIEASQICCVGQGLLQKSLSYEDTEGDWCEPMSLTHPLLLLFLHLPSVQESLFPFWFSHSVLISAPGTAEGKQSKSSEERLTHWGMRCPGGVYLCLVTVCRDTVLFGNNFFFPFSTPKLKIIWIHPLLLLQETERPQPYLKWDRCLWNCGFKSIFQLSSFLFYTEQSNVSWLINALSFFFFFFPRRVWYGSFIDQPGLQGYFCPKQNGNRLPPHKPSVTHTIKRTHKYLGNYSPFT